MWETERRRNFLVTLNGIDCKEIYFGNVLQRIRKRKRLTLEVLGDFIGYSTSNIQRWESNTHFPPHFACVVLMCEVLRCTVKERLDLEEAYYCTILRDRGLC